MAIRTVHQVISKKGLVIGEYMDLKLAKEMDNRTDVLYYIADLVEAQGLDEAVAEKVAESLLQDEVRHELLGRLKTVKDLPMTNSESIKEPSE